MKYYTEPKKRRTAADKLKTFLFGKDLRVTEGEPYTKEREYDYSSYYPKDNYIYPQQLPSENVFDIRDYGADVSKNDNAEYINKAIEKASGCCGTVLVVGGEYISTTVILKSNVTLFIAPDSSITCNDTGKGYNQGMLLCENAENVILTGGGTVKGNGHLFGREPVMPENNITPAKYIDVIEMRRNYRSQLRFAHPSKYGGIAVFNNCKNITVDNFIMQDSPHWTFKLVNCDGVTVKNFIINNNRNVANADGIDIAGSSNIDISHTFISTADDGIVIKNAIWLDNKSAMSDINITDCEIISRTNAIKVGTETTYDVSKINISNCKLFMTDLYPGSVSGISLEACDGTVLSQVKIRDIVMDRCTCPIFIRLGNRNRAGLVNSQSANAIEFGAKASKGGSADKNVFNHKSRVSDIYIENVKADNVEIPIIIAGYKQKGVTRCVENVTLNNIKLNYVNIPETVDRRAFIPEYAKEYPEGWRFRNLPAYALWCRHTKNITLNNFECSHPQKTWKKDIIFTDKQ